MDATGKKLVSLLESPDLELRIAAIRALTAIGLSSKPVIQGLGKCLREQNEELQVTALKGLARLGAQDVSQMVVPLILSPGALREHAMAVISAVGPTVAPQLQSLYDQADFHGKRAVITALARVGSKQSLAFLLKILPGEPFELQKHLSFSICDALDRMQPEQQAAIFPIVIKLFKSKAALKNPQTYTTGIIILGHFRGRRLATKARAVLRGFAEKKHPPEVRRYSLVSLNRLIPEAKVTPDYWKFMIKMLCDDDWHNVAQHALTGFQRLELPPTSLSALVDLLHRSPHFSVHIHIFERLQVSDRPEIARAVLPFLADSRFRVREAAESALRRMPSAIEDLFKVLMESDDLEVTQRVNSILRDFPQDTRKRYVDRAAERLLSLFEANDPHYRSFLEFIRGVDPEPLRKRIYQRAKALKAGRAKDKWSRLSGYLQLLWDNHLITPDGRYLFAVSLLRQSTKDLAPASRRADLGLRVIRALVYDDAAGLAKRLVEDEDLEAEDYFYLGFHFSEEGEEMRAFGTAMLEHVVQKYPKSKVAGPSAHKLQLQAKAADEAAQAAQAAAARKARSRKKAAAAPAAPATAAPGGGAPPAAVPPKPVAAAPPPKAPAPAAKAPPRAPAPKPAARPKPAAAKSAAPGRQSSGGSRAQKRVALRKGGASQAARTARSKPAPQSAKRKTAVRKPKR
jgi:hypothetical protein